VVVVVAGAGVRFGQPHARAHTATERRYKESVRVSRALAAFAFTLPVVYTTLPFDLPAARANGRFPKAQAIVLPAHGDGSLVYLRTTFGVLVSHDALGAKPTWDWLCEQSLGFSSTWDPPLAATRDGRLWIALPDGARATKDGCSVADVPQLKGELVMDLATDASGDRVFAVTSSSSKPSFVWKSGASSSDRLPAFTRLGSGLSGFRFDTVEVAPSSPSRLYLTATPEGKGPRAHLFRSDDGGVTLRELSPPLSEDARLFVSSVDPNDPNRLYVRALAATGSDVLLSTDGGQTLSSVLHMKGAMFGFARTPDGQVLYAGSGDPAEGIWRSRDRGATWQARAKTSVFCLNADGPRLLVCSNPYTPGGYAIAESRDEGATVTPLATFDDVRGPVACDSRRADASASPCASSWPEVRAAVATSAHVPSPSLSAAAVPDASRSDAAPDVASRASPPSSCGCVATGAPHDSLASLALALVLPLLGAARRSQVGSRGAQRLAEPAHRTVGIVQREPAVMPRRPGAVRTKL
jgi:hypothetical protein